MHIDAGIISKTGRYRDINADIARAWNKDKHDAAGGRFFIVADGTGRADHGKVAAQLAVTLIPKLYYKQMRTQPGTPARDALLNALHTANRRIYDKARQLVAAGEMGVAVVVAVLQEQHLTIVWAGNCRAYLVPQENVDAQQVTLDHVVTRAMSAAAETGDLLLPILGAAETVRVGVRTLEIKLGDALVLCSDGVHQVMKPADIARIVKGRMSIRMAANDLISTAKDRDSNDNTTALVVRLRETEEERPPDADDAWATSHAEVTRLIQNLNLTVNPRPEEENDVIETKEVEAVSTRAQDTDQSLEAIYHDMVDDTEFDDIPDDTAEQIKREREAEFQAWFDNLSRELQEKSEPSMIDDLIESMNKARSKDNHDIVLGDASDTSEVLAVEDAFDDLGFDLADDTADVAEPGFLSSADADTDTEDVIEDEATYDEEADRFDSFDNTDEDKDDNAEVEIDEEEEKEPNFLGSAYVDDEVNLVDAATESPFIMDSDEPPPDEAVPAFEPEYEPTSEPRPARLAVLHRLQKSDWLVIAGSAAVLMLALGILGGAFVLFGGGGDEIAVQQTSSKPSPALTADKETPSPTAQPVSSPTPAPTLPPSTFSGVPNGWEAGTVLYITRQTGARRDVFSPPTDPNQYQRGDAVVITLARQRVGYREWYEYDGERWWFVDNIGWLAEDELSENP